MLSNNFLTYDEKLMKFYHDLDIKWAKFKSLIKNLNFF